MTKEINKGKFETSGQGFGESTITQILMLKEIEKVNRSDNNAQSNIQVLLDKTKSKVYNVLIPKFKNLLNDFDENNRLVSLDLGEYSPKSKNIFDIFINLTNGEKINEVFKLHTIKAIPSTLVTSLSKHFEFEIIDFEKFKSWISDIEKILSYESKVINKEKIELKKDFIKSIGLELENFWMSNDCSSFFSLSFFETINDINIIEYYDKNIFDNKSIIPLEIKEIETIENNVSLPNTTNFENKVGIIDTKITKRFHDKFKNLVDYENLIGDKNPYLSFAEKSHAEAVSSLVMFGDQLNNFNDDCGIIPVKIFAAVESGLTSSEEIISRIKLAVQNNPNIKIWVLSFGLPDHEQIEYQITPFGIEIDEISMEWDVKFIIAGGNDKERKLNKGITPPSDSELSITVNSLDDIDGDMASYSRFGFYGVFGNKPTFSYFGGDNAKGKFVNAVRGTDIYKMEGTSFAAPLLTRRYYNIYYSEISVATKNRSYIESNKHSYSELKLISQAITNTDIKYFNDSNTENQENLFGAGKVPTISEQNSFSFLIYIGPGPLNDRRGKKNKKRYNFANEQIPLPKIRNSYPYTISISSIILDPIDHEYGSDYIKNSVVVNTKIMSDDKEVTQSQAMGTIGEISVKPYTTNYGQDESYKTEVELFKKGKWKRIYTEKLNLSIFHRDIDKKDLTSIQLSLERAYRYSNEKDFSTLIMIEYSPINPSDKGVLEESVLREHNKFGNEINDIEVDVDVDDIDSE